MPKYKKKPTRTRYQIPLHRMHITLNAITLNAITLNASASNAITSMQFFQMSFDQLVNNTFLICLVILCHF